MKTKNLFLAASLLLAISAMAQIQPYPYNSAILSRGFLNTEIQTIVRHWDDTYVISYHAGSGGGYFSCSDFSGFWDIFSPSCVNAQAQLSDPLPVEYEVKDMRIFNDNVFFCGLKHDFVGDIGFVGWFDLNLFMTGNFTPHIQEINNVTLLRKMTVYKNNGPITVVAIGDIISPNSSVNAIVEISDINNNMICSITSVYSNPFEELNDILYLGNKLVFVGTTTVGYNNFFYTRIVDDTYLASNSTNINNYYYFFGTNEVNGYTASTSLIDDNFAISYVHCLPDQSFVTRIRVIDINSSNPTNVISQEFPKANKEDPLEMVYSIPNETLALLQPIDYFFYPAYYINPQFIFLKPLYTSPYTTYISYFQSSHYYTSLDTYGSPAIVSVADQLAYLQEVTTQNTSGCPFAINWDVYPISNMVASSIYLPLNFNPCSFVSIDLPLSSHSENWNANCCSY